MAIHEQESRNQAIYESIISRTEQFHNAHKERLDSQNISHIWEYLGWTPREWDEYVEKRIIPLCEFKGKQVSIEETTHFPITRHFTIPDTHPFDAITWEKRQALITKADGEVVFQQDDVEFPSFWSQNATNIVASKYFRGQLGTPQRESSVAQMINRVAITITNWGKQDGYFSNTMERHHPDIEALIFLCELQYILVNQIAAFNSPVYFNIGVLGVPQQSAACFLIDVQDNMEDILEWYRKEAMIFKSGSGSGVNVSKIRGKNEGLSGGGKASGPLSFMKAADASAGVIQSGGKTRRAAKLVVMDMDHPDIEDFIWCKALEERKARALVAMGYDDAIDGEAYATVAFQNANHSVSVTDEFLQRVVDNNIWCTFNRTSFEGHEHNAAELFHQIAQAAWECGDPGLFFHNTVNAWNTTPERGPILSGNPCQEVMQPPDTSCNLAAINLLKFLKDDNTFDIEGFCHTVNVMITAQEILVGRSDYPTPDIKQNSHDYRPLGLGFANLGALLMAKGLPYDSHEGRDYAASITALMTGQAYKRSAELAAIKGPFNGFAANREPMLVVIDKHHDSIPKHCTTLNADIWLDAHNTWVTAALLGRQYGYRNSQVTLCQPTGTVALMMDCVTTGCEPDVALVNYKKLVGGGTIKHVNDIVPRALKSLGYADDGIQYILDHINEYGCVDDIYDKQHLSTNYLAPHHKAVFDCAFPSKPEGRAIAWEGHVKMVAALQPFLSGSLSKTCNIPNSSTVEDIERAYMMAWKLGCKTISVYRDGCKQTQVLTTQNTEDKHVEPIGIEGAQSIKVYYEDTKLYEKYMNDEQRPETHDVCQTCGNTTRTLVYPYGSSPALLCTTCMDSINQRIKTENNELVPGVNTNLIMPIKKPSHPQRRRLPDERAAITHKFSINNQEGYLTIGLFEDGTPGEIFLKMAKEGSTLSGFADGFATMVSLGLQYGIPLEAMITKFSHSRFEPTGWTPHEHIHYASSILDYIFRYLQYKFMSPVPTTEEKVNVVEHTDDIPPYLSSSVQLLTYAHNVCPVCGNMLYINGACQVCKSCGFNSGCSG